MKTLVAGISATVVLRSNYIFQKTAHLETVGLSILGHSVKDGRNVLNTAACNNNKHEQECQWPVFDRFQMRKTHKRGL
jgi:hypothetical protein